MHFCLRLNMDKYTRKLYAVLLIATTVVNSEVTVENGGYSIMVSFSQNVPSSDGEMLVNKMKESLNEASEILHNAIGLHFSKITFKIPATWDTSAWNATVEHSFNHANSKSDLLIDDANDVVFGKLPFTQQYGGCGIPGNQITVPTDFFNDANTFPRGISLAREWLKYRYGVFDENGYWGDSLYPEYYVIPGENPNEIEITDCTNIGVTYNIVDKNDYNCSGEGKTLLERLDSGECKIKPDEVFENITYSFMYFQQGIHAVDICGKDADHKHNSRAPNKHNVLCNRQSIWEIVRRSPDFKNSEFSNSEEHNGIEYVFVQENKPKVVVAWENTAQMKDKGQVILNAIKKFMIDLPNGSKFNGFPFKSSIPTAEARSYDFHELNGMQDKKRVEEYIFSEFVRDEDADINLALSTALDIFSKQSSDFEDNGIIIIVTKSSGSLDGTLRQKLKDSNICIMLMFYTEGDIPNTINDYTSSSKCGTLVEFQMTEKEEDTFEKLLAAMEATLPRTVNDKVTESVKTEYLTKESAINVVVDNYVEIITFWIFSKKESENFELKFNDQIEENVFKEEIIGSILTLSYSPKEPGNVEFKYPHDTEKMLIHVTKTSKKGNYFSEEIFVYDTSEEGSSDQLPVIIYASIRFGAYPVQNAKVFATIEGPNGEITNLDFNDDGRGDPDITQNDGIYSRYFTSFSEKGDYVITVTVENNGDLTTFGADENTGYQTCCGSYVNGETSELTEFSKVFQTTFTARNGRPIDGYKPSRILDLRVHEVTEDKIILKWTASGEEADNGTAQSYEIKCFTSQDELLDNFDDGKAAYTFHVTASSNESSNSEIFEINFSNFQESGLYYIAIKARNSNKKASDLSNTIEVIISAKETTDSPDNGNKENEKDIGKSNVNNKTVGIIIGIIVAVILLVILVYLAIYFLVVKPKRRKQDSTTQAPKRNENNVLNPINFVSAATLIEHHNEKTKAKMEHKEPPIFTEEDFEKVNSLPRNESREIVENTQELNNKDTSTKNGEPMPPKSPKRTTYV